MPRTSRGCAASGRRYSPFPSGRIYVNYESDVGVDRLQAAYGAAHYERLVALKNTYDPTNLFRLNQNIKPTV